MPVYISPVDQEINTIKARAFRAIVTAGWANKSDGEVEALCGHFALITIEPNELRELIEAVFDDDATLADESASVDPGYYLLLEDSAGNSTLVEYANERSARDQFEIYEREYAKWSESVE